MAGDAKERVIEGIAAAPGLALGPAWVYRPPDLTVLPPAGPVDPEAELGRWEAARRQVRERLDELAGRAREHAGEDEAAIFAAHRLLVDDPELDGQVRQAIAGGRTAAAAVATVTESFAESLEQLDDEYLRGRAADIRDVGRQLLAALLGVRLDLAPEEPSVIVAHDLAPSDTARWPRERVLGLVTEAGGATSHVAILARAAGVPAVAGAAGVVAAVTPGQPVVVDGSAGQVVLHPTVERRQAVERALAARAERARTLAALRDLPAVTPDGRRVELAVNIGRPEDIAAAEEFGPEGVGLFRTEFLFLDRSRPPGEETQWQAYVAAVRALKGRRLVLRTLDVGADKRLPFIDWPDEMNPALGWRGARLSLERPDLLQTQLRAMLRAAAEGPVSVMFPMVTTLEEVRRLRHAVEEAAASLEREGVAHGRVEVGIMVETPAAALSARALAGAVDFFSIGTNDLTQYTLAVDRTSQQVAALYDPLHPAVLRLILEVGRAAEEAGIWAGVCGELAGEPLATPFLLGAGMAELSMHPRALPEVKRVIRAVRYDEARQLAGELVNLPTGDEVRRRLRSFLAERGVEPET
ncbi:phosphoenolpyruvate-protein phosphotransferase [Thermaerobacter marianensis DSM 12885]|uniref:Phosphoenolpyruvate-protein phosphotransferase n=1 Tax=Thermaerobacter marianensis (strain ATCC 700841 / DSM 12885 / JCM 10246 / 7p75a) TaxID=644966 RepID=E6SJG2_THEM7|nr:phosphoenolpyruvate-protein phosphotransferase [Thermaerobacter marianensis DSM 12885]